eukprot:scaffold207_cov409-Prasinococcus_capsulatus_cf.AAC.28
MCIARTSGPFSSTVWTPLVYPPCAMLLCASPQRHRGKCVPAFSVTCPVGHGCFTGPNNTACSGEDGIAT